MITYYATYEDAVWYLNRLLCDYTVHKVIIDRKPNGWFRIEEVYERKADEGKEHQERSNQEGR